MSIPLQSGVGRCVGAEVVGNADGHRVGAWDTQIKIFLCIIEPQNFNSSSSKQKPMKKKRLMGFLKRNQHSKYAP